MLYHISETLFDHAINNGHTPCDLGVQNDPFTGKTYRLLSFPVKNELRDPCDKDLIINSAHKLVEIADTMKLEKIYLVRPGYGIDLPDYDTTIRPELHKIFDDRFYILDYLLN